MHHRWLGTWMARRALKTPDRIAVVEADGSSVSYAQLADRSQRVAALLAARGIGHGDRVAYLGENSADFLAVLFGTVQIGAVFVPLNTRLAPPELMRMLQDSSAGLLIHDPVFTETARAAADGRELLVTHGADSDNLSSLMAGVGPLGDIAEVAENDAAVIVFTSGTTGRPKGAVLTHGNLTWNTVNALVDFDFAGDDIALLISPMFHVAALGMGALPLLLKGGTLVLAERFEAGRALTLIQQHRVTVLTGVPTTYQLLADHPAWPDTDLSSVRIIICGGSAVPRRVLTEYARRGLHFSQNYGMTEAAPGVTALPSDRSMDKIGSAGLPHFFTDVRIMDAAGVPCPAGTVGEIQVSGPHVFAGYDGLPDASAAAFTEDGYLRTGDLGQFDGDGYLYVSDRLKDLIISGGENIYPAEVEDLLCGISGIVTAAVIGVADDRWGEVPWALVTVTPGSHVDTESVRSALDGLIARYKMPAKVIVVDQLPATASGKINKAALRREYRSE